MFYLIVFWFVPEKKFSHFTIGTIWHTFLVLVGCTDSCIEAGTSSTCTCPISKTETVGGCFCNCGNGGRAGPNDYCYDNNDGRGVWSYAEAFGALQSTGHSENGKRYQFEITL